MINKNEEMWRSLLLFIRFFLMIMFIVSLCVVILKYFQVTKIYGNVYDQNGNCADGIVIVFSVQGNEIGRTTSGKLTKGENTGNFLFTTRRNLGIQSFPGISPKIYIDSISVGEALSYYVGKDSILLQVAALDPINDLVFDPVPDQSTIDELQTSKNSAYHWEYLILGQLASAGAGLASNVVANFVKLQNRRQVLITIGVYLGMVLLTILLTSPI